MPLKSSIANSAKDEQAQFASLDSDGKEPESVGAASVPDKPAAKPAPPSPPSDTAREKPGPAASIPAQQTASPKKPPPEVPDEELDVLFHALIRNFVKVLSIAFHLLVSRLISPIFRGILKALSFTGKGVFVLVAPVRDYLVLPIRNRLAPYFKASLNAYLALLLALIGSSVVVALLTYNRTYGEVFKLEEKIAWLETERENDDLMIDKLSKANNQYLAKIKQIELLLKEKDQKIEALYQEQAAMYVRLRDLNARLPANLQSGRPGAATTVPRPSARDAEDAAAAARKPEPCTISNSRDVKSAVLDCLQ